MKEMIMRKYYCIFFLCAIVLSACDEWDEHNKIKDEALTQNLLQRVNANPELSLFSEYLAATGYDKVLESSKTFTVWAPSNDALASLSSDITGDVEKLTAFIGNHISYQEYFKGSSSTSVRVQMLNGKYLTWDGNTIDAATVITPDQLSRNGVLHVTSGYNEPKKNTWDVLLASAGQQQAAYMQSLTYDFFVDSLATQIGVDPNGQPIYEPGTGIVMRNYFLDQISDINDEDSLNTFIVLTDDAFTTELAKLTPYFKTITVDQDSTDSLASWHLVKDLVFKGRIEPALLPDTLISQYGVKVPIDKSAILETHYTSNGIVYVMNKVDFRLKDKFPPIIIEGERPNAFSRSDKNLYIHYRYRDWASSGIDLRVHGHGIAQFNVRYRINNLHAMTYKVYWHTVNDFIDTTYTGATTAVDAHVDAFQQKLVFDLRSSYALGTPSPGSLKDFGYVKVNRLKTDGAKQGYKLLGEYTHANYRRLYLFLVANNSTDNRLNPIEMDYIKLVPVF
jgi:hypothetical protein